MRFVQVQNLSEYTHGPLKPNGQDGDTRWMAYLDAVYLARDDATGDIDNTMLSVLQDTTIDETDSNDSYVYTWDGDFIETITRGSDSKVKTFTNDGSHITAVSAWV